MGTTDPPERVPTVGLRERKKAETRRRIAEVAARMFVERGYENVRMIDIAHAAEISEPTLYNYFPTKEHLIFDRDREFEELILQAVLRLPRGQTLAESLRGNALAFLDEISPGIGKPSWVPASVAAGPELRRIWLEINARCADALTEVLINKEKGRLTRPAARVTCSSSATATKILSCSSVMTVSYETSFTSIRLKPAMKRKAAAPSASGRNPRARSFLTSVSRPMAASAIDSRKVVAATSTHFEKRLYPAVDGADKESCRPDFAIALYPGHLSPFYPDHPDSWTHENPLELNPNIIVTSNTPATFLLQAQNDPVDDVRNSMAYSLALRNAKVPVELHLYAEGGHGFGLRRTKFPITEWPMLVGKWLRTIGMTSE